MNLNSKELKELILALDLEINKIKESIKLGQDYINNFGEKNGMSKSDIDFKKTKIKTLISLKIHYDEERRNILELDDDCYRVLCLLDELFTDSDFHVKVSDEKIIITYSNEEYTVDKIKSIREVLKNNIEKELYDKIIFMSENNVYIDIINHLVTNNKMQLEDIIIDNLCPSDFGLKNIDMCDDNLCRTCWKTAVKCDMINKK